MKLLNPMIKRLLLLKFMFVSLSIHAGDTLKVETKVEKVVVFLKGAQTTRQVKCNLKKGENWINFTKISSLIDEKSINVKPGPGVTLQSVYFYVNHMDSLDRINRTDFLQQRLDSLENKKLVLENFLFVLKNEEDLFNENLVLSGEKKIVNTDELIKACAFYRERLTDVVSKRNKTCKELHAIESLKLKITLQLYELNSKKEKPVGEIIAHVYVDEPGEKEFRIEYFTEEAGWQPKYDIRAESVSKPVILSFKADVFQNTDDDWKNVELTLSSSNPAMGGTKPELKSWTLNLDKIYVEKNELVDNSAFGNSVSFYNNLKNDYSRPIQIDMALTIKGTVVSADDLIGLPGVGVVVKGASIATITDLEGKYTITVPKGSEKLIFEFIGMETEELPITGNVVNCVLSSSELALDEVVVTAYGIKSNEDYTGSVSTLVNDGSGNFVPSIQGKVTGINIRGSGKLHPVMQKKKLLGKKLTGLNTIKENQTSVQFLLDKPYTILSDNKNYAVDIEKYEIPVHFQYSSVPKLDASAFLLARLTGWEKLNLLSGIVNIYFEGSFIGNSKLDVEKTNDTLDFSLGRDNSIMVDRNMIKDFSKKQFLSKWKTEAYTWEITVRNNKSDTVSIHVTDQVPISDNNKCVVELMECSQADYDKTKGELSWDIKLGPLEKKIMTFTYQIKIKTI